MPNDKEKVIRQLRKELQALAKESIERTVEVAKLEAEVKAMEAAVRIIIDQQWKSVEDEMPTGGYYLTYKAGEMKLTKLTREFCEDCILDGIACMFTHWMPLPSAPT